MLGRAISALGAPLCARTEPVTESNVSPMLTSANLNPGISLHWRLEFVVEAEEGEILVVVCILKIGVFENKAIIEPKGQRI